jgi:hypothetical protein
VTFDLLAAIRRRLRDLLKDPIVNSRRPECRTLAELCSFWAKSARMGKESPKVPVRVRAIVRLAREAYRPYTMAEVRQHADRRSFVVCSLFAGAGGCCLGYQLAGGDVRLAVEFSPSAARTYRRNNQKTVIEQRDIRSVLEEPAGVEALLLKVGLQVGELDHLFASPPCTEYSLGGAGIGDQSRPKVHGGVKQTHVASLPFEYARFLHRARPKTSVMENVTVLRSAHPSSCKGS